MDNIEQLVKQHKIARETERILKQAVFDAKSKIPFFTDGYDKPQGKEARENYKKAYKEWQDIREELEKLEIELDNCGYAFPSYTNDSYI